MLHLSESDANCSRSTKYVSKLVKDFLEEPLEKKTVTPKSFACHHLKTLLVEFFNAAVPSSVSVESLFSLGMKMFFAQKG